MQRRAGPWNISMPSDIQGYCARLVEPKSQRSNGKINVHRFALGRCIWWQARFVWRYACRRCSNCIFILDSTPGFNGLGKDNCKTRRKTLRFWDSVRPVLEVWQYIWYLEICIALVRSHDRLSTQSYWQFNCLSKNVFRLRARLSP